MSGPHEPRTPAARYDWLGWSLDAAPVEVQAGRLLEVHEHFHRQLDDSTAFGGLTTVCAALADAAVSTHWVSLRDKLKVMSDLLHETHAVGMSLLTTQRPLSPIPGYPAYDRYVAIAVRLLGEDVHPWVAIAALRAAATACMQTPAIRQAADVGLQQFDPATIPRPERPNHRLSALLAHGFNGRVAAADRSAKATHGDEAWWQPRGTLMLAPEAMDGAAGEASEALVGELLDYARSGLDEAGGHVIDEATYHAALRHILTQAQALAVQDLPRIGALLESPGGALLHGGALDSQTIRLTAAPPRAVVLPQGTASGLSGVGRGTHAFVVLTRPERIRRSFEDLRGVELPDTPSAAFLRSTIFEDDRRVCVLHVAVTAPEQLDNQQPVFLSALSSAVASDPEVAAKWIRAVDPDHVSLVMDTPASAALRRWCVEGARFRMEARVIVLGGMEVRIIAGRVEQGDRRSALVVIPTSEFGVRWFEAARSEDGQLRSAIQEDATFFEQEGNHIDVVLNHLLFEERFIGTGSWRR